MGSRQACRFAGAVRGQVQGEKGHALPLLAQTLQETYKKCRNTAGKARDSCY